MSAPVAGAGVAGVPAAVRDLLDAVAACWPGAEVSLGAGRRRDPTALAEYAVVPGPRTPVQVVPLAAPRAAGEALLRFSAAAGLASTGARLAAAGLARGSRGAVFGHRVRVHGSPAGSLSEHLAGVLGEPVVWSLGLGTARVNRKPVLQVFGRDGRTRAFVKLGTGDAEADVRAEADALERVAAVDLRTLEVPRLVSRARWDGTLALVLGALRTSARQRPGDQWRPPVAAMDELAERWGEPAEGVAGTAWWAAQVEVAGRVSDREAGERFAAALDRVADHVGDRPLRLGGFHGDWTPWNCARVPGRDRWQLWDFERFETGVPQGLDLAHYLVNATTRRDGASRDSVVAGLAGAGGAGSATGLLYLVAATGRYLHHRERERGAALDARTRLLLDVLEEQAR